MKHDVMRTLAEARPDELTPGAPDAATRENELTRAMASSRLPAKRRVRPAWGLGLVAAAAAAALVATALHQPGDPSAPSVAQPPLTARSLLLGAAEKAEAEPAASGTYWHIQTVQRGYYRAGGYTIVTEERSDEYAPTKPGLKMWGRQQYLGARPATPADVTAWKKAGAPTTFKVSIPVGPGAKMTKPAVFATAPGKPTVSSSDLVDGNKIYWLGRNVTYKDLSVLPADPARLKASLLRWYTGHSTEALSVRQPSDEWLFDVTAGLITAMPVTPKVRAAAFRMLADLKTIEASGPVTDSQGRKGTAVTATTRTSKGTVQKRLIIDTQGRPLARDTLLAGAPHTSTTITKITWTNHTPR
ncbi:CU044_5270 family protein [Spirillospora sp. CA-294931]|uniref:CU044_5270 family protein n=1 Tax=Spirillospora sp. CA-294931 TaxID=3240042 RepID=UPI003D8BB621